MPIPREEFESTLDRPAYLALQFLRGHMDAAYTATEIAEALAEAGDPLSEPVLERVLAELVSRQWVEASARAGRVYYSYRRWLGLRRR